MAELSAEPTSKLHKRFPVIMQKLKIQRHTAEDFCPRTATRTGNATTKDLMSCMQFAMFTEMGNTLQSFD